MSLLVHEDLYVKFSFQKPNHQHHVYIFQCDQQQFCPWGINQAKFEVYDFLYLKSQLKH